MGGVVPVCNYFTGNPSCNVPTGLWNEKKKKKSCTKTRLTNSVIPPRGEQ